MLDDLLRERNVPSLLPREAALAVLQQEEYGFLPQAPENLSFAVEEDVIPRFCGGDAVLHRVTASFTLRGKPFSFPFSAVLIPDGRPHPFFVHINFRPDVPDRYMPTEELVDNGFAVLSFCYKDVASDDGDFTSGLAGLLFANGERRPSDPGKIALWAWAASRVLDWAETRPDALDRNRSVVCGHSRLGKTALLAAATDSRFAFAYSNDSGCSGAALARGTRGERVRDICRNFPFWFCENYLHWVDNEDNMPFDQHDLIAAVAPRKALIGSASEDDWADPISEQLACAAAGSAFPNGFDGAEAPAQTGEAFLSGDVGYHLRRGRHCFTRKDWHRLMQFVKLHSEKTE